MRYILPPTTAHDRPSELLAAGSAIQAIRESDSHERHTYFTSPRHLGDGPAQMHSHQVTSH
ncbi:hypothetical protein [Arthrobacter sp. HLT1-20]